MDPATGLTVLRGDGHIAYRLLDDPDLLDGWLSDFAAQRRPMSARANALLAMGLSMWNTLDRAREANGWLQTPYGHAVGIRLDGNRGIWWARTITAQAGHYTVWGRPEEMQASVEDIHPV